MEEINNKEAEEINIKKAFANLFEEYKTLHKKHAETLESDIKSIGAIFQNAPPESFDPSFNDDIFNWKQETVAAQKHIRKACNALADNLFALNRKAARLLDTIRSATQEQEGGK